MLLLIIPLIVLIITICQDWGQNGIGDYVFYIINYAGSNILAIVLILFIGFFIPAHLEYPPDEQKELTSINNKIGTSGSFFIGTGSIGQSQYYFYMEKTLDGFIPRKIKVDDNVLIREVNDEKPNIKHGFPVFNHKILYLIAHPGAQNHMYIITVPQNSIKHEYNLQ